MISPQRLDTVPDRVVAVFEAMDDELRRISARALTDPLGANRAEIRNRMSATSASYRRRVQTEIRNAVADAVDVSMKSDEMLYERARVAGLIGPYTPIADAPYAGRIITQGIINTQTAGNIVRTSAEQRAYAGFVDALDTAVLRITTGQASPQEAIREAVNTLARTAPTVTYTSSAGTRTTTNLYSAVRRSVLTGAAQTTQRLTLTRAAEVSISKFEVSAHMGARPDHAEWQGGIYTLAELYSVCGLDEVDGLNGVNCRHQAYPFVDGISEPSFGDIDSELNAEQYELSQRQRTCERNIRAYKSRVNVYREAERATTGDISKALKADKDASQDLVRKWQRERDSVVAKRSGKARTDREVATIR